jgi:hypothetical protein
MRFQRVDDWFIVYLLRRWYVGYERGHGWTVGRILI